MTTVEHKEMNWRTDPMYTFKDAARIARISTQTVRNWIFGTGDALGSGRPPLLYTKIHEVPLVSFLQLMELMVAARLRKAEKRPYEIVRLAHINAKELLGLEYPFAHAHLVAIGGHIVHYIRNNDAKASFQALDSPDQWSLPGMVVVREVSREIDYIDDLAARWWPGGKASLIVVDPRISAGVPTVAGRGVTAAAIYARLYKAREPVEFIMKDFRLNREQVDAAINYCERRAA